MNADILLARVAAALQRHQLDAIPIQDAAALPGVPLIEFGLNFAIRKTPENLKKLRALARELNAVIFRPCHPASDFYRMMRDDDGLQINILTGFDKATFERLRAQGRRIVPERRPVGKVPIEVETTTPAREQELDALKKESDLALRDQIRRLLALPVEKRTNFLCKRIGFRMTAI